MKRLHELSKDEWLIWERVRREFGREKYGDAHKERYTLLDEMEELFDLTDIHRKGGLDRIYKYAITLDNEQEIVEIMRANNRITDLADELREAIINLDKLLPDKVCSDNVEERIGW